MKRAEFIKSCIAACSVSYLVPFSVSVKDQELPNVLLLGDSISIGYTPFVKEILKEKASISRPMQPDGNPENCSGTTLGVTEIDRWIGTVKWDLIHFNFGLHDIKHVDPKTGNSSKNPEDPLQADLKNYIANMEKITDALLKTGAILIFATTTPVPPGVTNPLREPDDVIKYNKAAIKIMKRKNIVINDLYSFALPRLEEIQLKRNVHFNDEGYKKLAGAVAEKIRRYIQ